MKQIDWDLEGDELDKAVKQHEASFRETLIALTLFRTGVAVFATLLAGAALLLNAVRAGL